MSILTSIDSTRIYLIFFFQAEDGIRDGHVTGVQTCALPICRTLSGWALHPSQSLKVRPPSVPRCAGLHSCISGHAPQIGRASCRERVESSVVGKTRETETKTERTEEVIKRKHQKLE